MIKNKLTIIRLTRSREVNLYNSTQTLLKYYIAHIKRYITKKKLSSYSPLLFLYLSLYSIK